MKKIISAALLMCLVLCLCACDSQEAAPATEAPVVVTEAPTEAPAETEPEVPEGMVTYTVTVVDEEGNPISGAMVQICLDACIPAMTNEEGVAEWTVEEADYKVSFLTAPAGYAADTENYYFESGSTELTLTLKAAE
ncbi:MAG: hypothetical protein J6C98_02020 [Oscillospiraceae bacterium]|nr:hypothetical protein [Oscillospiraceae bacterium]